MNRFPEHSVGSSKKGLWLVFEDNDNKIHCWSSPFTGVEKIYFNGELVDKSWSLKKKLVRTFEKDGHTYEFTVESKDGIGVQIDSEMKKDGVTLNKFRCSYSLKSHITVAHIAAMFIASLIFGFIAYALNLPKYSLYIFAGALVIFSLMIRNRKIYKIEEIDEI